VQPHPCYPAQLLPLTACPAQAGAGLKNFRPGKATPGIGVPSPLSNKPRPEILPKIFFPDFNQGKIEADPLGDGTQVEKFHIRRRFCYHAFQETIWLQKRKLVGVKLGERGPKPFLDFICQGCPIISA